MWHRLHKLTREPGGRITAEVDFPQQSQWVEGHFPDDPLIPAVAQLSIVREALGGIGEGPFIPSELNRVKFKAMVRPGERLNLEITPKSEARSQWQYRLFKGREMVGSGFIKGRFS